ncbi:hypothetical protein E4T56_gene17733, partial [Termitomyces sp. T112]
MQDIHEKQDPPTPVSEHTMHGTPTETDASVPAKSCSMNEKETFCFDKLRRLSHSLSYHRLFARFSPALTLENSGSVARDHLASERTFLAYVRTSLLSASTGVGMHVGSIYLLRMTSNPSEALVQLYALTSIDASNGATLGPIPQYARPIGAALVVFGLLVLILGVYRYFVIQQMLTKGLFPATQLPAAGVSLIAAAIT